MGDKNIQIRNKNNGQWDSLYPYTLSENIFNEKGEREIMEARNGSPDLKTRLAQSDKEQKTKADKRVVSTKKPTFALIDDDGNIRGLNYLVPTLESRNFKGTFAVITGSIGEQSTLSASDLVNLQNNGHEIISHSHTHPDLSVLNEAQLRNEFTNSVNTLNDLGIEANALAYPNGRYSKLTVEVAKDYFDSAVITGPLLNEDQVKTFAVSRIGIGPWGVRDWNVIKETIDVSVANNLLCVLMTHCGENTASDDVLLEQALDYINSLGFTISTYSEAFNHHKNVLEYGEFRRSDSRFQLEVGSDGSIFNRDTAVIKLKDNEITSKTPPEFFSRDAIYHCYLAHSVVSVDDLPEKIQGSLITNSLGLRSSSFNIRQEYVPAGVNRRYERAALISGGWSDWVLVGSKIMYQDNEISQFTTPLTFKRLLAVHYGAITYSKAAEGDLPLERQGLLITNSLGYRSNAHNISQEYHPSGINEVYRRVSTSDENWTGWVKAVGV